MLICVLLAEAMSLQQRLLLGYIARHTDSYACIGRLENRAAHLASPLAVVLAMLYRARRSVSFHPSVQFTPSRILNCILHVQSMST